MRRLSLSTKLIAAVVPVLLALGVLAWSNVRDGRAEMDRARLGATLGASWDPLVSTMRVIEAERSVATAGDASAVATSRRDTNTQMVAMNAVLVDIGGGRTLVDQLGETLTALGLAREAVDRPEIAAARRVSASDSYDAAEANLVSVGRLLVTESQDRALARDLTAVAALAEVEQRTGAVVDWMNSQIGRTPSTVDADRALRRIDEIGSAVAQYRVVADAEGLEALRSTGITRALDTARRSIAPLAEPGNTALVTRAAVGVLAEPLAAVAELRDTSALAVVDSSDARAAAIERETWMRIAGLAALALVAGALALAMTTSISRRIKTVSRAAREVSSTALPALVDALHDPRGTSTLPAMTPIDTRGHDEVAELAASFNALQVTLGEVATEQLEVLHRGVSELFVTMARRNRSLVDRQLSLLDELESDVTDPDVLADYYRLDHLATRMRRNSDSLLVLAGADSSRRRIRATEIDTVVRAAVGEVEDYQRVEIVELEPVKVRGVHVADMAHLLAELIDNATAFSPPDSRVRVEGAMVDGQYRLVISDEGIGLSGPRLRELNTTLATPPVVGLSVEPTLGMSVVSLLAARHGLQVRLSSLDVGTSAEISVPLDALELPAGAAPPAAASTTDASTPSAAVSALLADPATFSLGSTGPAVDPGLSVRPMAPTSDHDRDEEPAEPAATAPTPTAARPGSGLTLDLSGLLDPGPVVSESTPSPDVAEPVPSAPEAVPIPLPLRSEPAATAPAAAASIDPLLRDDDEIVFTIGTASSRPSRDDTPVAGIPRIDLPADLDLDEPSTETPAPVRAAAPAAPTAVLPSGPMAPAATFAAPSDRPAPLSTLPPPPPPSRRPPRSEFDRTPAPPEFLDRTVARPVVDPAAASAPPPALPTLPRRTPAEPPIGEPATSAGTPSALADTLNGLPVRTRKPDVSTDVSRDPELPERTIRDTRPAPSVSVGAGASTPSALGAALSAFTTGRRGERPGGDAAPLTDESAPIGGRIDLEGIDLDAIDRDPIHHEDAR